MVDIEPRFAHKPAPSKLARAEARLQRKGDDYWKVGLSGWATTEELKEFLIKHGYPMGKKREANLEMAVRADRGLLSYSNKPANELRKFTNDRNIQTALNGTKRLQKAELVQLLQTTDDHASLKTSFFTDLPAELRVRIYQFHLASLTLAPHPTQPPITKTSNLARKESLPLFYATCTFHFHFHANRTGHGPETFLARTSALSLGSITRFTMLEPRWMLRGMLIDIGKKPLKEERVRLLERRLDDRYRGVAEAVVEGIVAGPGGGRLTLAGLRALFDAVVEADGRIYYGRV